MSASQQFPLEPRAFPLCPASPQCPADGGKPCRGLFDHLELQARGDAVATARLLAVVDSQQVVERAADRLSNAGDGLISAAGAAEGAVARLRTFVREGRIGRPLRRVAEVQEQQAADGAFDRSRRLLPGRWTAEVLIGLAALFDTLFFGSLFSFLINIDDRDVVGRLLGLVAYVPGFVLAASLLVAGLWLGEAVERHGVRRTERHDAARTPAPEWWLPLGFLSLVLITVASVAWLRPQFVTLTGGSGEDLIPSWVIMLLLLMLTVTAIAAKVAAHNSYAAQRADAERERDEARAEYQRLRDAAANELAGQQQRWRELRDVTLGLLSAMEDLWAAVARQYDGAVEPPVRVAPRDDVALTDAVTALAQHVPYPPPSWGLLLGAAATADSYAPDRLRDVLDELTGEADIQWSVYAAGPADGGDAR